MKRVKLERFAKGAHGTLGLLEVEGVGFTYFTLEEEDLDNRVGKSSIPVGTYPLEPTVWHKYGIDTYELMGVPGRSRILVHPGNTEEDMEGCILIGLSLGVLTRRDEETGVVRKKIAVLKSRAAFRQWMEEMGGEPGIITVTEAR